MYLLFGPSNSGLKTRSGFFSVIGAGVFAVAFDLNAATARM
jgi:hypothetical protein